MQAALFASTPYRGPANQTKWPAPVVDYSAAIAEQSLNASLDQMELADRAGFDWVTVAEHHFSPTPSITPNPMVMAGAVTQRVQRAKVALLGPAIPILNPVRVAEEFAMLDTLTGGRVVAGMMRGTSNEYVTYNTNPAESRERFAEALQLILRAWTEPQPFGWQGRYFEYRTISIWPRPVQQPHPPVFMSGSSPESGEFAARHRIKLGLAVTTLPIARAAARYYREQARLNDWEPTPEDVIYRVGIHVAPTDEQALADLRPAGPAPARSGLSSRNRDVDETALRLGYYGRDADTQRARLRSEGDINDRIENGQILLGSPEAVWQQIKRLRDEVGAGVFDLIFAVPDQQKALAAIELFAKDVLPRLHAEA